MLTVEKIQYMLENKVLLDEGESVQFSCTTRKRIENPPAKVGMVASEYLTSFEIVLHNEIKKTSARYQFSGTEGLSRAVEAALRKPRKSDLDKLFDI